MLRFLPLSANAEAFANFSPGFERSENPGLARIINGLEP